MNGQLSQCDRVLAVLADGEPHSMREIHERAGFMRLNSRVSELRDKRKLDIRCTRDGRDYIYQLVGMLSEAGSSAAVVDTALTADESVPSGSASGTAVLSEMVGERQGWQPASLSSPGEQLTLEAAA